MCGKNLLLPQERKHKTRKHFETSSGYDINDNHVFIVYYYSKTLKLLLLANHAIVILQNRRKTAFKLPNTRQPGKLLKCLQPLGSSTLHMMNVNSLPTQIMELKFTKGINTRTHRSLRSSVMSFLSWMAQQRRH